MKQIISLVTMMVFVSCGKDTPTTTNTPPPPPVVVTIPVVATGTLSNVFQTTATGGGSITSDGGASITQKGVCWSTSHTPTTTSSKTSNGTGTATFLSQITGLTPSTTYYVRAYATNSAGTGYGDEVSFTTPGIIDVVITTVIATTGTTASCTAVVSGGQPISQCGLCWSTNQNPTVADKKTISGRTMSAGYLTADYSSILQYLRPTTTYYVRAYATSSTLGTFYSNQLTYTTGAGSGTVKDVDGNEYLTEAIGSQVWMVENLKTTRFNDGSAIAYNPILSAFAQNRTGSYCWYDNDTANKNSFGALYNWFAVTTGKVCPAGWHVPTDAEWTVLENVVGGESVAGRKLLAAGTDYWVADYGTNTVGFTAQGNGYRSNLVDYGNLKGNGLYWSSTAADTSNIFSAWSRTFYLGNSVQRYWITKEAGGAIRCVKN
jgi:uncharacterized protein (TIGR02145 family)